MKKPRHYILLAGVILLLTSLLHLIGGQIDLIYPIKFSGLTNQVKAELVGAWHMVTAVLFFSSYYLLKAGLQKGPIQKPEIIRFLGYLFILFSIPSVCTSIYYLVLAPQWILLLPIGVLSLVGVRHLKG